MSSAETTGTGTPYAGGVPGGVPGTSGSTYPPPAATGDNYPPPPAATEVPYPRADAAEDDRTSLGELIGELTQDLSKLMRQELELAKAELSVKAKEGGASGARASPTTLKEDVEWAKTRTRSAAR